jgi:hypothetical protein
MTPEEKAKELFYKFSKKVSIEFNSDSFISATIAKQCVLIAVDEILKVYELLDEDADIMFKTELNHWQEVKKETEKL